MKTNSNRLQLRLGNLFICMLAGVLALSGMDDTSAQSEPMKIGIIGTGNIGGTLARLWVNAGHEELISSRHPQQLQALAQELGPRARAGTPQKAAAFGEVILVSVPYSAMPQIGNDYAAELAGKVILDTGNPFERRDGPMAAAALQKGVGKASAEFLKTTRLVRAYNCIPAAVLAGQATRTHDRIAIPIAGDDAEALAVAEQLVRDSGFDPVVVGNLGDSRIFELGQPLASGQMTAAEMQQKLKELK